MHFEGWCAAPRLQLHQLTEGEGVDAEGVLEQLLAHTLSGPCMLPTHSGIFSHDFSGPKLAALEKWRA